MDETLSATATLLVQQGILTQGSAWQYQQAAQAQSYRFLPYVVMMAQICPNKIAQTLAEHFELPMIDLTQISQQSLPKQYLTRILLRQHHVLPIKYDATHLYLAIDDPHQQTSLKDIQFLTGLHVIPMVASTTQLSLMIDDLLRDSDHQNLHHYLHAQAIASPSAEHLSHATDQDDEAPIVAFVQRLFHQAITRGATDVHFEPYDDRYRIRYRHDGVLNELASPPQGVAARIAARLKIMADLDIAERRLPQDGRFTVVYSPGQSIDCRFSSCPTINGEKIAIRILNAGTPQPSLDQLGLSARDKHCFLRAMLRPQGLILVTGPTGSGKTITLYAALQHLNTGDKNISTAEDPVEIKQSGINQVQINPKIGLSFATILRSFLRQDPDVIMVGEIRDYDTADMAIKAAHTGHLVLSTLHTNSAAETLVRLKQIGIAPFLLSSTLTLIIAQRLIRLLCPHCKTPALDRTYIANGCHRCLNGYRGRAAVFEVMPISASLQQLLHDPDVKAPQLTSQAQQEGMLTLHQAGLTLVHTGVTSLEEITRII